MNKSFLSLKNLFIYLFTFGCAESSLLHGLFSSCSRRYSPATVCRLSCPAAYGIFPDQGVNWRPPPPQCKANSQPLDHQGSPQFSSITQWCPTLCDPMNRSTPGLSVHHQHPEFIQTHVHESVMPSSHFILCRPLLLLSLLPPSIRVFSKNESTLHMRWPKYWSFSFSISPSKEHPGLISFRMDWLDLLAV